MSVHATISSRAGSTAKGIRIPTLVSIGLVFVGFAGTFADGERPAPATARCRPKAIEGSDRGLYAADIIHGETHIWGQGGNID